MYLTKEQSIKYIKISQNSKAKNYKIPTGKLAKYMKSYYTEEDRQMRKKIKIKNKKQKPTELTRRIKIRTNMTYR